MFYQVRVLPHILMWAVYVPGTKSLVLVESLAPIGLGLSLACDLFGGWVLWNKFWPHLPKASTIQLLLIFTGDVAVLGAA